jgi:hypothetical protein
MAAQFAHRANNPDWMVLQTAAIDYDKHCFRPPDVARRPKSTKEIAQAERVISWVKNFDHVNGALGTISQWSGGLSFDRSVEAAEAALQKLGEALGADSQRPEKELNEGPDNLWIFSGCGWVIEVKSNNEQSLHKKDAGQIHQSVQWYRKSCAAGTKVVPVIAAKVNNVDRGAQFPVDTRSLMPALLIKLIEELQNFYRMLGTKTELERNAPAVVAQELVRWKLDADSLLSRLGRL